MEPVIVTRRFIAEFGLGETVYLRLREVRLAGMVTRITFSEFGTVFAVSWANGDDDQRYGMELTREFTYDVETDHG